MSNRFHAKYHRKNHHTYGNATNPEASHDPIASPDQPFLGDFSLQGSLCAVAPASAFAGYFYSNNTALCAIAANRGIFAMGLNSSSVGIASYSLNVPLSTAYGKNLLHGQVGINKNTITTGYVLDVLGNTNLDGNLNVVGDVDIDGGDLTASTTSFNLLNTTTTTINFGGAATNIEIGSNGATSTVNINGTEQSTNCTTGALVVDGGVGIAGNLNTCGTVALNGTTESTSCTTGTLVVAGGVGIAKNLNVCGTVALNGTTESTSCTTGALVVAGGVGIAKNLNVCGNAKISGDLTVDGTWTYLNTQVQVTSAVEIYNMGTGPALKVTQSGTNPIAHFIDSNGDDIVFNDDGYVGLGTMSPNEKLTIVGNISAIGTNHNFIGNVTAIGNHVFESENSSPTVRITQKTNGTGDVLLVEDVNNTDTTPFVIKNDGKVGIGETAPEGLLHVKNGSAGTVTPQSNSVGIFENSNNCYISLLSPNSNYAGVVMGGPGNPYGSYLSWNHDNLDLKLATNHANADMQFLVSTEQEAMRISSSGNVGIGSTNPTEKLTVSGRVSATGYRANQGSPSNLDASTNGYSFLSDGDTGVFSPIIGGGAANGVVSLFSNNVEKLRADTNAVTIFGTLSTTGSLTVNGSISNDPKAPVSTTTNYSVTQVDHDKTILANHATNTININLPSGLKSGTQISVIRKGAGIVQFAQGTGAPTILSTPTNAFTKLGFQNSVASAYWTGNEWYLVGDLLT